MEGREREGKRRWGEAGKGEKRGKGREGEKGEEREGRGNGT